MRIGVFKSMALALPIVVALSGLHPSWAQQAPGAAPAQAPLANATATTAPGAGAATVPDPKPDDTNAQRNKSQPGNNAPIWRAVRDSGGPSQGFTSLPGAEQGVLIQSMTRYPGSPLTTAGEAWRQVRNAWILPYGGALFFIAVLALALFYWRKGPLGQEHADSGRRIERFTPFERAAHWTNAIAFTVLAISGLVMAFGKFVLLPVLGGTLFGWMTYALKTMHNFAGPLFAVSLVIVLITFFKDNLPHPSDWAWLRSAGGLFGKGHEVPSHRFNAGEKAVYWGGALALGLVVVVSGLVLDKLIPGMQYLRSDMQVAHLVHAIAAILMMCVLVGHIYMGTVGMRGAFKAMKTGQVDEAWAREHHELWYDDIKAGKIPAQRSPAVAPVEASASAGHHHAKA